MPQEHRRTYVCALMSVLPPNELRPNRISSKIGPSSVLILLKRKYNKKLSFDSSYPNSFNEILLLLCQSLA
jgi:hypothetical protein